MRIRVFSDLHTEFGPYEPPRVEADVVVLAGDIGVKLRGLQWALKTFPDVPVLYVPGNHEYYGAAVHHHPHRLEQRGYPDEQVPGFDERLVIEL